MVDSHDAETYSAKDSRLIWIDCEMTGLDIFGGDELVEVSVVPTDFDLNVLDEGVDYVIKPSEKAVNHMAFANAPTARVATASDSMIPRICACSMVCGSTTMRPSGA